MKRIVLTLTLSLALAGCGEAPSPVNNPAADKAFDAKRQAEQLKQRSEQCAQMPLTEGC